MLCGCRKADCRGAEERMHEMTKQTSGKSVKQDVRSGILSAFFIGVGFPDFGFEDAGDVFNVEARSMNIFLTEAL